MQEEGREQDRRRVESKIAGGQRLGQDDGREQDRRRRVESRILRGQRVGQPEDRDQDRMTVESIGQKEEGREYDRKRVESRIAGGQRLGQDDGREQHRRRRIESRSKVDRRIRERGVKRVIEEEEKELRIKNRR